MTKRRFIKHLALILVLAFEVSCDKRSLSDVRVGEAITRGDTNYIQNYISVGTNINRPVKYTQFGFVSAPPIHLAIMSGQVEILALLLRNGANPNQVDSLGLTPLHQAVRSFPRKKRIQIMGALIDAGAGVDLPSRNFRTTPLIDASSRGDVRSVEFLLAAGANVNAGDSSGATALHYAENAEVAKVLIAAGVPLDTVTSEGETPADTALRLMHFDAATAISNALPKPQREKSQARQN